MNIFENFFQHFIFLRVSYQNVVLNVFLGIYLNCLCFLHVKKKGFEKKCLKNV